MCTVRNSSHLLGGVPGPREVSTLGGAWSQGVCSQGVPGPGGDIPACTEADPSCEQNDRQV